MEGYGGAFLSKSKDYTSQTAAGTMHLAGRLPCTSPDAYHAPRRTLTMHLAGRLQRISDLVKAASDGGQGVPLRPWNGLAPKVGRGGTRPYRKGNASLPEVGRGGTRPYQFRRGLQLEASAGMVLPCWAKASSKGWGRRPETFLAVMSKRSG